MLPYLPPPMFQFSKLSIHLFGIMAVTGILMMKYMMNKQIALRKLNPQIGQDLFLLGIGAGYPLSHVSYVLWHTPLLVLKHPVMLLQFYNGLSSLGGALGLAIVFFIYRKVKKRQGRLMPYCDCGAYALFFGLIFCRIGCAFSHDHPGIPSHSLLAIDYPASMFGDLPRHNLGLEEALGMLVIFLILTIINQNKPKDGVIVASLFILYSPFRFFLDFLRATDLPFSDARYGELTLAQWGCLALFFVGIYILRVALMKRQRNQGYDLCSS